MKRRQINLIVAAIVLLPSLATAEPLRDPSRTAPAPQSKAVRAMRAAKQASSKEAQPERAPCPQGTWRDDPACFGESDQDALPIPSAHAVEHSNRSPEPTIKPTANLNPRPTGPGPYQAGVVYQSNGNAVTSNYGGGVSVQLPF
jgi:hypothetical protein